jgi:lysophospholipase L1-like esterase
MVRLTFGLLLFLSLLLPRHVQAQDSTRGKSILVPGSRVAIIGDSITEQKMYTKYMEAYLLACSGVPDVQVFQFGWSGEQAGGFAARMENDLTVFNPTIATLCYGMNDGGYQPFNEEIGRKYEANMRNILGKLNVLGVKSVVVGSPGAVDTHFFRPGQSMGDRPSHVAYNDNLAHLRDIDRRLASEKNLQFADVHATMFDAMTKAQSALGKTYDVCGKDGFHPGSNGQLLMAYAFLKGMGLDGNIGEVMVDLKGKSSASDGHSVVEATAGKIAVQSNRWPFCFHGDEKSSSGNRSILPFTGFNSDLNRLILKVKGLDAPHALVKWGDTEKKFSRDQLTAGVNLAEAFSSTPFDSAFQKLTAAIEKKQSFETYMIKTIITQFRSFPSELRDDEELKRAVEVFRKRFVARHQALDADVRRCVIPVKHSIEITPATTQ